MDPLSWVIIGTTLASLIGQFFIGRSNVDYQTDKSVEANKELTDYSHELNIEDWNKQNEYNLPANQYSRYVDAGASPAAAMQATLGLDSNASIGANTAGSPSVGQPAMDMSALTGVAGHMMDLRRVTADERLKDAQARLFERQSSQIEQLTPEMVENLRADTLEKHSQVRSNEAAVEKFKAETDRISKLTDVEREQIVQNTNLIIEKINEIKEAVNNLKEQRNLYRSEEALNYANAELATNQATGEIYENYDKMVSAMKSDIDRFLIENYHVNPDDEFWKMVVESASKGEDFGISFLQSIGDFAEGVDSELTKHFPNYKTYGKLIGGAYLLRKITKGYKADRKEDLDMLSELADLILSFSPKSVVNPIGFNSGRY